MSQASQCPCGAVTPAAASHCAACYWPVAKGDRAGHPFRGNQYTRGRSEGAPRGAPYKNTANTGSTAPERAPRSPATQRLQDNAIARSRDIHNARVAREEAAAAPTHDPAGMLPMSARWDLKSNPGGLRDRVNRALDRFNAHMDRRAAERKQKLAESVQRVPPPRGGRPAGHTNTFYR